MALVLTGHRTVCGPHLESAENGRLVSCFGHRVKCGGGKPGDSLAHSDFVGTKAGDKMEPPAKKQGFSSVDRYSKNSSWENS